MAPMAAAAATSIPPEVREASAAMRDGRVADGLALLDAALAREPESAAAHSARGMALLSQGRFREGFAEYEWRHRVRGFEGDRPPIPRWGGGPAEGKTLLLWDEQGLGDTIQFSRFAAAAVRASRARVVVCVNPRLGRLLRSGARGWEVRGRDRGFPPADLQLSLASVPAVLGLDGGDLGCRDWRLTAEPEVRAFWRDRLASLGPRPRVGLTWRGNPRHPDDRRRSAPLAALARVAGRWSKSFTLVSLQKAAGTERLDGVGLPIVDLGPELDVGPDSFVDTAAVMSTLDLIVTTDTAAAHLAGSLGLPVWLLLSCPCDWRWSCGGERSVFYETARLFRQPATGDWDGLFDRVSEALDTSPLLAERRSG